jgi:hypothetical protein
MLLATAGEAVRQHPFLFFSTAAMPQKVKCMSMQFEKVSGVPGLSPEFCKRGGPDGVKVPVYTQDSGRTNADRGNGTAGGEIRRSVIVERGGSQLRPSHTDLSKTYYRGE